MISWVFVTIGGFFGAMSRFGIGNMAKKIRQTHFPFGTLFVNLLGSFFLGYVFASASESIYALFGVGFLGAFTTYSTMNVEAVQLFMEKRQATGVLYLGVTYLFGVILAYGGYLLAAS